MRRALAHSSLAIALRRRLRRCFGITAATVSVRVERPWYIKALSTIVLAALLLVAVRVGLNAWQTYRNPDSGAMRAQIEKLEERLIDLERENTELRSQVQAGGSTLQIERSTQDQLSKQVRTLSEENARLKQDLTLFDSLAGGNNQPAQVAITTFIVEPHAAPGRYRYRLVATQIGARDSKDRDFRGYYQLLVKMQQGGQAAIMTIPANEPGKEKFALKFKQFQRVEGVFQVPEGAVPASVEVRLLADGATRATKSITL